MTHRSEGATGSVLSRRGVSYPMNAVSYGVFSYRTASRRGCCVERLAAIDPVELATADVRSAPGIQPRAAGESTPRRRSCVLDRRGGLIAKANDSRVDLVDWVKGGGCRYWYEVRT